MSDANANTTGHTPGPWKVEFPHVLACDPRETIVCVVTGAASNLTALHDANVLAAAPNLLDAARRALQFIENGVEFGFIRMPDADAPDPAHETPSILRAAIEKAEGQA